VEVSKDCPGGLENELQGEWDGEIFADGLLYNFHLAFLSLLAMASVIHEVQSWMQMQTTRLSA
jgi:hypothetical protein